MKSRVTVIATGIIAFFSWWLLSTEQSKQSTAIIESHFIDAFIKNFKLTVTDEFGKTSYTLKAERLEHYNDRDNSTIINPVINIPQHASHWKIRSDFGEIDSNQVIIKLSDNVILTQLGTNEPFEIKTENITINTKSQIIESDQTVNIQNGPLKLISKGMRLNNVNKQLSLLSDVNGTYDAQ